MLIIGLQLQAASRAWEHDVRYLIYKGWWGPKWKKQESQVPHAASLVKSQETCLDIPPPPAIQNRKTCERGNKEIHGNGDGWKNLRNLPWICKIANRESVRQGCWEEVTYSTMLSWGDRNLYLVVPSVLEAAWPLLGGSVPLKFKRQKSSKWVTIRNTWEVRQILRQKKKKEKLICSSPTFCSSFSQPRTKGPVQPRNCSHSQILGQILTVPRLP